MVLIRPTKIYQSTFYKKSSSYLFKPEFKQMHFHRKPVQISDSFEFKINIQEDKKKFLIQIDESIHPNVIENDISIKRERSRGRKSYHS